MRHHTITHDAELPLADHLDEIRTRIFASLGALLVAFGLCMWQDELVLSIANAPLHGREPITLGVTESFMTTITMAGYAAILLALPVILYEFYAFVLPAFSRGERRVATPLLLMIPALFVAGVAFSYFVVVPKAIGFLLAFNADNFDTQIRARDYYSFLSMSLVGVGLLFQVPVAMLALARLGITTPAWLRQHRRQSIVVIAIVAMLLPSVDPVSMVIEMAPLILLYELGIVLATLFGRPATQGSDEPAMAPR